MKYQSNKTIMYVLHRWERGDSTFFIVMFIQKTSGNLGEHVRPERTPQCSHTFKFAKRQLLSCPFANLDLTLLRVDPAAQILHIARREDPKSI